MNKKLSVYQWRGINEQGALVRGENSATHAVLIKADLCRQKITPLKIRRKWSRLNIHFTKNKITPKDIYLFTRQIGTLFSAGIPLILALDLIANGQNKISMKNLISSIKEDIVSGLSFTESLKKYPLQFNSLYCSLIHTGEQSGTLDKLLMKIAAAQEKSLHLKNNIKKALLYPCVVLAIATIVTTAMLIFIVPQFASIFKEFGATLPPLTRATLLLSSFVKNYGWFLIIFIIAVFSSLQYARKRFSAFAFLVDSYLLHLPVFGQMLKNSAIARFTETLSTTLNAGLPLASALALVADTAGNRVYTKAILNARENLINGQTLQLALQTTHLFPTMVNHMIHLGEESGTLEKMLTEIAAHYGEAVDHALNHLSSLLEPVIMVILGIIVTGLVTAMYLPIFKLGAIIH